MQCVNEDVLLMYVGEFGMDVKARDSRNNTALHFASQNGFVRAAAVLLAAGADVNAVNGDGWSVLDIATSPELGSLFKGHGARFARIGAARPDALVCRNNHLLAAVAAGDDVDISQVPPMLKTTVMRLQRWSGRAAWIRTAIFFSAKK